MNVLKSLDSGTPLTNNTYLGSQEGEVYGIEHNVDRFMSRLLTPKQPIQNLYLSGQDVATCGIR